MSYGRNEFSEGDRGFKATEPMPPRNAAVEQWQSISIASIPDAGVIAAQRSVDQLFGVPAITGKDGTVYLQGHVSNVPEVSQGIQNLDDLKALGAGVGTGLQRFGQETLNYMSKPNAFTDSLLQLGPALDNAFNYYANTPADQVGRDAQTTALFIGEPLENTLGYPLTPEQRGQEASALMPVFLLEGMKEPLHTETAQQLGLSSMNEADLAKLGIRRAAQDSSELHMPEIPEHLKHLKLQPATQELIDAISQKGIPIRFAEDCWD